MKPNKLPKSCLSCEHIEMFAFCDITGNDVCDFAYDIPGLPDDCPLKNKRANEKGRADENTN